MNFNNLKIKGMTDDVFYKMLLSSGINLEYYDQVICSVEYIKRVVETKSLEFWYSGLTITLSNGTKRTILFIWGKYYDLETSSQKMHEILSNLSEAELEDMSKRSLKQSLKRIRKTNINLN